MGGPNLARASVESGLATVSRSAYVSRIRRAFLLRVHPDRFRNHDDGNGNDAKRQRPEQRRDGVGRGHGHHGQEGGPRVGPATVRTKEQASLVHALVERLGEADFLAYSSSSPSEKHRDAFLRPSSVLSSNGTNWYPYAIEGSDGQISKHSIRLDSDPRTILTSMAASIDFPPPPAPLSNDDSAAGDECPSPNSSRGFGANGSSERRATYDDIGRESSAHRILWVREREGSHRDGAHRPPADSRSALRGRDLRHFLGRVLNPADVAERKIRRLHAASAALSVRNAYRFASVDGTGLGWSSESLSVLLRRLAAFHDEYRSELRVASFYPFRLVLGADESSHPVDAHGGTVRLHPAATPLQWLATLSSVTAGTVDDLRENRADHAPRLVALRDGALAGRVRVARGRSCDPWEFHSCVARLAEEWGARGGDYSDDADPRSEVARRRPVDLVVESEEAVRRAKVCPDGSFQVGAGITLAEIRDAIVRHSSRSEKLASVEARNVDRCRTLTERAKRVFGLAGVRKASATVIPEEMSDCLSRLLEQGGHDGWNGGGDEMDSSEMRRSLMGQTLGIAGHGRPCHLGDDGSIVIPLDFI